MKIVDLRPALERHFSSRWIDRKPEQKSNPTSLGLMGSLWSRLADDVITRLVASRADTRPGPFVLSIGNLALGGTGKTPVIMALASDLAATGKRGCVLTRGFKSPLAGPLVVEHVNELAGDEARLMALRLEPLGWPVVQARNRTQGLSFILAELPVLDFILVEDGHQTRGLGRHLDVLILDRWIESASSDGPVLQPVTGPVFPLGPYRETARGAERAAILLVETPDPVPQRGIDGQIISCFTRQVKLRSVSPPSAESAISGPYGVLSGIARPVPFEGFLGRLIGRSPELCIRLRDHQEYSPSLVVRILAELDGVNGVPMVTTAKDWVKLKPFWPGERPLLVADLELEWGQANALPQLVEERAL